MKVLIKSVFPILLLLSLMLFACQNARDTSAEVATDNSPDAFDLDNAKAEIAQKNKEFGEYIIKGDSVGIGAAYTDDAQLMLPNSPGITGRDKIAGLTAKPFKGMKEYKIETTQVVGNADLLVEDGRYTITRTDGNNLDSGKYLAIWKAEDGQWKKYRVMVNSDMPPAKH